MLYIIFVIICFCLLASLKKFTFLVFGEPIMVQHSYIKLHPGGFVSVCLLNDKDFQPCVKSYTISYARSLSIFSNGKYSLQLIFFILSNAVFAWSILVTIYATWTHVETIHGYCNISQ